MAVQAEKDQYKHLLDTELGALMFPTQLSECQDTHCKREDHLEAVNWFAVEMMEVVQTAGETALPFLKAGKAEKSDARILWESKTVQWNVVFLAQRVKVVRKIDKYSGS